MCLLCMLRDSFAFGLYTDLHGVTPQTTELFYDVLKSRGPQNYLYWIPAIKHHRIIHVVEHFLSVHLQRKYKHGSWMNLWRNYAKKSRHIHLKLLSSKNENNQTKNKELYVIQVFFSGGKTRILRYEVRFIKQTSHHTEAAQPPPETSHTQLSRQTTPNTTAIFLRAVISQDLPLHFTSKPTASCEPVTYDTVTQSCWHNLRLLPIRYSHYNGTTSFTLCKVPAV